MFFGDMLVFIVGRGAITAREHFSAAETGEGRADQFVQQTGNMMAQNGVAMSALMSIINLYSTECCCKCLHCVHFFTTCMSNAIYHCIYIIIYRYGLSLNFFTVDWDVLYVAFGI